MTRRKNIVIQTGFYWFCRRFPKAARRLIRRLTIKQLPEGYPVDEHFNPATTRGISGCASFRTATCSGRSARPRGIVTDRIDRSPRRGIRLTSGRELEADIVVTATGLRLLPLGGITLTVDGEPVELAETLAYKGMMLSGVPNFAFLIGYTNASWTLKVGLVCERFTRLLSYMDAAGHDQVTPTPDAHARSRTGPLLDFTASYVMRSVNDFPRQGASPPWQLAMNPNVDRAVLLEGDIEDPALRFSRRPQSLQEDTDHAIQAVQA